MATDRDVAAYEPKQCEKCEGHGAIEGKYCDCSSGQMAVRDALNRGDHVAVAFNHETGKKDVFVDRKHKPKVARAEPSRGAPEAAMDVERYARHKNAQAVARDYGLDPTEESFAKCVDAILYVTNLGLEVRDAWQKRAEKAESGHVVLLEACKGLLEELRLIRMKDTNAVYDPTIRVRAEAAIQQAERT